MRYRIIQDEESWFVLEKKAWWWFTWEYVAASSVKEKLIERLRTEIVKDKKVIEYYNGDGEKI